MSIRSPHVFNIAGGQAFLSVLAEEVLGGFPLGPTKRPLSDWTILLPTKRAANAFTEILLARSGKNALVLPRVRPLGDLDEDLLHDELPTGELPPPMSALATMLELTQLAKKWALLNPKIDLAREIMASPSQAMNLARSLNEIIITAETHQLDVGKLEALYNIDVAEHRQTIASLLQLVLRDLPEQQKRDGLMGPTARRGEMIRAEARRIAANHEGPIIAAGSTGTIPATRELLLAISLHPQGAVVLPGLDLIADDESWSALKPEHPQFALKTLLIELGLARKDVKTLGAISAPRNLLASEIFRPTETTPMWHTNLPQLKEDIAAATIGITEIAAPDRHLEARAIACILRAALANENKTAALITPDRDLAGRVIAEMGRWNIAVHDSAGEVLSRRGLGAALDLLLQAQLAGFAPVNLIAFLRHPLVTLGLDSGKYATLIQHFELAVLRGPVVKTANYVDLLAQARLKAADQHAHPIIQALLEDDWAALAPLAEAIDRLLAHFNASRGLDPHLASIEKALHFAIDELEWNETSSAVIDILVDLKAEASRWPDATASETALLLRQLINSKNQPPSGAAHSRLTIMGTLEARLLPFDLIILGGLNESVWPKGADPGPWLNRTMRDELTLPLPERDIGMAAHDFEQAFCVPEIVLTWSKRLNHAPQSQSRWLLRMKAVLAAAGVTPPNGGDWLAIAQSLHFGGSSQPISKPSFAPPVASRPIKFSVTEVERLIRNPYAIYARRILKLEPLPEFGEALDARMRGTLFHDAIGKWNAAQAPSFEALVNEGEKSLALLGEAQERHFWAPHFAKLAKFLWDEQPELAQGLLKTQAEISGQSKFMVAGVEYKLSAKADRIDILENDRARIIDYKTGETPSVKQVKSGFSSQLTLEAALLTRGAFGLYSKSIAELIYFKIGGGLKGREKHKLELNSDEIAQFAEKHWQGLIALLTQYRDQALTASPEERPC